MLEIHYKSLLVECINTGNFKIYVNEKYPSL